MAARDREFTVWVPSVRTSPPSKAPLFEPDETKAGRYTGKSANQAARKAFTQLARRYIQLNSPSNGKRCRATSFEIQYSVREHFPAGTEPSGRAKRNPDYNYIGRRECDKTGRVIRKQNKETGEVSEYTLAYKDTVRAAPKPASS